MPLDFGPFPLDAVGFRSHWIVTTGLADKHVLIVRGGLPALLVDLSMHR